MRRSAILRNVRAFEERFRNVDQTIENARELAYKEHDRANYEPGAAEPGPIKTVEDRIAADPRLADVYLSVNTKLGQEHILIRPTEGNPTGLTDLLTHPSPKETLLKVYDHTLAYVQEKFPPTSVYRTSVENLTKARRQAVVDGANVAEIEQKVGAGLVEEILTQAADEFLLAEDLAAHSVWEELEEKPLPDQWIPHSFKDTPE